MKIIGLLLAVLGLFAPIVTIQLVDADGASAASTAGSGFAIPLIAVVVTFILARGMASDRRRFAWLVGGVIVLAAGLWSSFGINRGATVYREYVASESESGRIIEAATAEAALLNSGQLEPNQVSPEWRPYAAETGIALSDAGIPLRTRFVEFTRHSRGRELALVRSQQEALRVAGVRTALAADHLVDAQARIDALNRIARYRSFLASYDRRIQELEDESRAEVLSLQLPGTEERAMIAAVTDGFRTSATHLRAFVERERKDIDAVEALIRFVDARAASARLADGRVTFADAPTQAAYEAIFERMDGAETNR